MKTRRQVLLIAAATAAVLVSLGCSRAADENGDTPQPSIGADTGTSAPVDDTADLELRAVDPPVSEVRDYELPPGCRVTDFTDRLAVYDHNTNRAYPTSEFGLLDLESGKTAIVLSGPVRSDRSYDAFMPKLSDSWLVWEEVSPNESADPQNAEWVLYAAPIDKSELTIGEPQVVDRGTTSIVLRPFYGVRGDEVVWSRNTAALTGQETPVRKAELIAMDLRSGARREVASSPRSWRAVRVSGDTAVITELADPDAWKEEIVVLNLESGEELDRVALPDNCGSSHFGEYVDGQIAWAAFTSPNAALPRVFASDGGSVSSVMGRSSDVYGWGEYLVFETVLGGGRIGRDTTSTITGVDLSAGTTWTLAESTSAYWEIPMSTSRHATTLVASHDAAPYADDPTAATTTVRRWELTGR